MGIFNLGFAILCAQFAFCVLPGVFGIYLLAASEDSKQEMRRWICNSLFGVSNAFSFSGFVRFLFITGTILLVFSVLATSFFVYSYLFAA